MMHEDWWLVGLSTPPAGTADGETRAFVIVGRSRIIEKADQPIQGSNLIANTVSDWTQGSRPRLVCRILKEIWLLPAFVLADGGFQEQTVIH